MIKEKQCKRNRSTHVLIDPSDESIVIVSTNDCTRLWIDGVEIKKGLSVKFSHESKSMAELELKASS